MSRACINLRERFGRRYKVVYEESYHVERGQRGRLEDPWLMIIPCKHGHIGPWDGQRLVACTDRPGYVVRALRLVPGAEVHQDGIDGANVIFHLAAFKQVAQIMRPRRRRRMSAEHRRRLIEQIRAYRYRKAGDGPESEQDERPCDGDAKTTRQPLSSAPLPPVDRCWPTIQARCLAHTGGILSKS